MARLLWTVALLGAFRSAVSKPLGLDKRWEELKVKHEWVDVPKGWVQVGRPPTDYPLKMNIGLKQERFDELLEHLYEVSDPEHHRYGSHLSKEEVDELVAPNSMTVESLEAWLTYHDIDPVSSLARTDAGDWVTVTIPICKVEKMLDAKYGVYKHVDTHETIVRTISYSLPSFLHEHVSVIAPTTYFGTMQAMKSHVLIEELVDDQVSTSETVSTQTDVPDSCLRDITPACLFALYNAVGYKPAATDRNVLGVAGYLDQFANYADLQTFLTANRPEAVGFNFTTEKINGGGDDQSIPGVEANLDIQYTVSLSWPTPNVYFSTGGSPPFIPDDFTPTNTNEPYLDWLKYVSSKPKVPQTITTSYGDDEQTVPRDYAIVVCALFAQLGVRGSSVLFSSGDSGVGGGDCLTNDGRNVTQFQPAFPASCPFVTAVGGTTGIKPETAIFFTGGGFSNYFPRPPYQNDDVADYIDKLDGAYDGLYNAKGRGFPDVAARGDRFRVVISGKTYHVGGTSASSPTVAGLISLLNDYRISHGRPPLGFLNPFLYSKGAAGLVDIVGGTNPGCGTQGFNATAGWDPLTGLGTLDFGKLQSLVLYEDED
ncbi:subtilisin-like protein [Thelephora ganbajun]|uniref:Subtilisin-like protein n=1 Tax=Thelephora ganbajun TaxID=370292 RepID=A0ACB6Z262_THEGA|nr:subtilisin-like protein [Thelephora ganbajun]